MPYFWFFAALGEGPVAWKWEIWFGFWALVWLVIACAVVWRLRKGRVSRK